MTLNDRLNRDHPREEPKVGRPVELHPDVEKAIVDCLILCAQYHYPMRRKELQTFVQAYCTENSVVTRY